LSDFVRVIPGDRLRDVTDSDWDGWLPWRNITHRR